MQIETFWEEPILIQFLILGCIKGDHWRWGYRANCQCHCWINVCPVWCRQEWVFTIWWAHKDNKAISLTDQQISTCGRPKTWKTTAGLEICWQWKDSSTSWEKLSQLKEAHPVQRAEFAIVQKIDHDPAFNWWVKHVLKKRDRKTASIRKWQTRYLNRSHKFGIDLLKTVERLMPWMLKTTIPCRQM